jgi:hypothetical protein
MAGIITPRKKFRFILELDGADSFLVQEITPPDVELAIVEHGSPGNMPNGKSAGKMKVGDLVLKKLKPANRKDTWAWGLMATAMIEPMSSAFKTGFLKEMSTDMVTPLQSHYLGNCWVSKITNDGYKLDDSENIMQEVTFAVQYYYPTDSPQFTAIFASSGAKAMGQAFGLGNS